MKKLFLIISFLFLGILTKANNQPKLTLQVYFVQASDTLFLNNLRKSQETCHKYEIVTVKSSENKILVCLKEQSIGVIYGYPTESFLLDIYNRYFSINK